MTTPPEDEPQPTEEFDVEAEPLEPVGPEPPEPTDEHGTGTATAGHITDDQAEDEQHG